MPSEGRKNLQVIKALRFKMKIDDNELWSVEVKAEDVVSAVTSKIHQYISDYHIRREDIAGIALGPNEFNALRIQLMKTQRFHFLEQTFKGLPNPDEFLFQGKPVFCAPRVGIQILVKGRWDIQITEARKYLSLEGLDS
jgi:hypothetical protein